MKKRVGIIKNKLPNIALFIIIDVAIICFTALFTIWMRFDFGDIPQEYFVNVYQYLFIDIIIALLIFSFFKLYTSVWIYASITELSNIVMACCCTEIAIFIYRVYFEIKLPRSYYIIQAILMILLVTLTRFSYRITRSIYIRIQSRKNNINVMLVGAGDAGRLIIEEMRNHQDKVGKRIVCVIDDDNQKQHSYFMGVPICGGRSDIPDMVDKYNVEEIIIAIPSASKREIGKIVLECQKQSVRYQYYLHFI